MSKKLKKKIAEIAGLNNLSWEERQAKAEQILSSPEWKQKLCNELTGLSFKELERYLKGVASEREKKEDSYERKLEAYNSGHFAKPPKRGRSDDSPKQPVHRQNNKSPRTLKQILAQVYAPRVSESESPANDRKFNGWLLEFHSRKSSEEVLPDSVHGDRGSDEQVG